MDKQALAQAYQQALDWVKAAGDYLREAMQGEIAVQQKSDAHDLVTVLDIEIERRLSQAISEHYPQHRICGEESQSSGAATFADLSGAVWFIDPIDGTINFVKQRRDFGIMLALYIDGKAQFGIIYDVMRDELYSAFSGEGAYLNGQRLPVPTDLPLAESLVIVEGGALKSGDRLSEYALAHCLSARMVGSTAIVSAILASGRAGAFISRCQMPWDIAAALAILSELGFVICQHSGEPMSLLKGENCLIATPRIAAQLKLLQD